MVQDDPGLQELVNDFVTESREHLANVEAGLLNLESKSDGAAAPDQRLWCRGRLQPPNELLLPLNVAAIAQLGAAPLSTGGR